MKRWMFAVVAGAALAAGMAQAAEDQAALDERLADAQRRLEDAAREVAELSGEKAGPAMQRAFEGMRHGGNRAMLGVNLDSGEPEGGGIRVAGVSPGGPAEEAGVKQGDVIVAIRSKPVTTSREVVQAMAAVKPGDVVTLGVRRDGKTLNFDVKARPLDRIFFAGTSGNGLTMPMPALAALAPYAALPVNGDAHWLLDDWGDAELVTLSPGLGRYFGTDKGVLVARAPEDAALGLKDGDVIVAIGGREPQNGRHAMRILRSYQPGESVELRILRDRKPQTLTAAIPERELRGVPRPPPAPPAPPAPRVPPPPPGSTAES